MAEHVVPASKPVTVNTAGEPGDAFFGVESTEPLVQVAPTETAAVGPEGEYTFETVNVADLSVFVIVHGESEPFVIATSWQPLSSFV